MVFKPPVLHGFRPVTVIKEGALFLIGRLSVAKVCGKVEAAGELSCGIEELLDREYAIAGSATPMRFDHRVPLAATERLLFVGSHPSKPLCFEHPGYLDRQALRGVRELDPVSAASLDELLRHEKKA